MLLTFPVIAAGGIADGRGIAAAFMLGAVGVQVGTRFLVAKECNIHQNYKNKILKAKDIDTIVTGKRLGHPVRSLKTSFSREFFKKEYDSSITDEQLEDFGTGALRLAAVNGDEEKGCFLSGQIASMVKQEQTCAQIITEMFEHAEIVLGGASKWVK
jgi:enoyl-[acyl-carrier protein] reductase II